MNDLLGIIGSAASAVPAGQANAADPAVAGTVEAGLFAGMVAQQMPVPVEAGPGLPTPTPSAGQADEAVVTGAPDTAVETVPVPVPSGLAPSVAKSTEPAVDAARPGTTVPVPTTTTPKPAVPTGAAPAPVPVAPDTPTVPAPASTSMPAAVPGSGAPLPDQVPAAAPAVATETTNAAAGVVATPAAPVATAGQTAPNGPPTPATIPSESEPPGTGAAHTPPPAATSYEPGDDGPAPQREQPTATVATTADTETPPPVVTETTAAAPVAEPFRESVLPAAATEHASRLAARTDGSGTATGARIRSQVLSVARPGPGFRGNETMSLQLDPEELGRVNVRLQARGDRLAVTFTATGPEAERALQEGARELAESIAARNGRFQQVDVRVEVRQGDERSDGRQEGRREETTRGSERDGGSGQRRSGKEPRTTAEAWAELARGG